MGQAHTFQIPRCYPYFVTALFAFTWLIAPVRASATQATPSPSIISGQVLAETTVASMPPAPSVIALASLTLAKAAVLSDISVSGPELIAVETGSLTVTVPSDEDEADEVESRVRRGGTPVAQGLATPAEGIFVFTLVPGDSLFVPGDTPHTIRNVADVSSTLLAVAVTPQPAQTQAPTWPPGTSGKLPEGVDVQQFDVGYDIPTSTSTSARITLQRVSTESEILFPRQQAGGPELFVVERGELEIDIVSGAVVTRDATTNLPTPIQADESAATPAAVPTKAGAAVLIQPGTIAVVKATTRPITTLVVTVFPV